jgi:hypothetical protein
MTTFLKRFPATKQNRAQWANFRIVCAVGYYLDFKEKIRRIGGCKGGPHEYILQSPRTMWDGRKMPHLIKAATRGETEKVAVHETGVGFPASRSLVCLKLDGQQQAALRGARGAVEAVKPDVVINFHVPLVQLTLQ